MVRRVHHIDFVVRDLDRAAERYTALLGRPPGPRERLPGRGVELVRFAVGGTWIILVQPVTADSPLRAHLDEHGEGFFHIAYLVDDLKTAAERLELAGIRADPAARRRGVGGWELLDLAAEDACSVPTQLVSEGDEG